MSKNTSILVESHGKAGLIRINRPKAMNALNYTVVTEIMDALSEFDDDNEIGAVVLTGNDKAFAAGADIKEMADASEADMIEKAHIEPFDRILSIKIPVIAAVSGWCLGGGNELAMSCDILIASESAQFGQPEINLGVIPGAGGTQRLPRAVGKSMAMEMVLNNRTLTANEALAFGLASAVYPVERYLEEALKLAKEIAARAPIAIRLGKEMVNHAFQTFLTNAIADERGIFYSIFSSEDQKEGMQAFVEKRPADWKGK
ncbi:MAG: enoyl-CoA hydratase-related protein [Chloroflexota bacterium]